MSITNNKVFRYFKESKEELRKVTWPSRKDAIKHTLIVIGVSVSVAVFLGLADYLMNLGLEQLIK
jgi:preprotein translocase subunit SecE